MGKVYWQTYLGLCSRAQDVVDSDQQRETIVLGGGHAPNCGEVSRFTKRLTELQTTEKCFSNSSVFPALTIIIASAARVPRVCVALFRIVP
jgi:hypothetical protein